MGHHANGAVDYNEKIRSARDGSRDGLKKLCIPSFIRDNVRYPQEAYIACCSKSTYPVDNVSKEENRRKSQPDKGSSHDIDLSEPPQQKPRRKKSPNVIKEDKPKRTRNPVTPKPVQSKENPTDKRRYVRRRVNSSSAFPTEVTGEPSKEKLPESAQCHVEGL
ncbi:unnamed protein product [Sphenostylis stenocarpa]|uniref:Uncharacterized protein n=1 Tax=Sphenostylis stenocarpa TaxID=92480 RepID=A0AA86SPD0_9FABA|nr:unnamed protein product [Sphenostylis stenocarpa]